MNTKASIAPSNRPSCVRRRRLRGVLRVVGLWSVLGALGLGLWARSAVAHLGEGVGDLGQQMLTWYGGKATDVPRRLVVNGLELSLQSAVTDATIAEVFDQFAGKCASRAGVTATDKPKGLLDSVTGEDWDNIRRGIVRRESESEGTIVCIDTDRPLDAKELLERVKRYNETHDLNDVGRMLALTARRSGKQTQMLMMGSVGPLRLDHAFPKAGDAPGMEPVDVPRPPESRRLFDATEQEGNNAIHVYENAGGSKEVILEFYRSELQARGFRVTSGGRPGALLAERGRRNLMVVSTQRGPDLPVKTTLLELSK